MRYWIIALGLFAVGQAQADSTPRIEVEMDTARIQSNRELPMLLYIVPWRDTDLSQNGGSRQIVIHNLFGDFYQPVMPRGLPADEHTRETSADAP